MKKLYSQAISWKTSKLPLSGTFILKTMPLHRGWSTRPEFGEPWVNPASAHFPQLVVHKGENSVAGCPETCRISAPRSFENQM